MGVVRVHDRTIIVGWLIARTVKCIAFALGHCCQPSNAHFCPLDTSALFTNHKSLQ